MYIQLVQLKQAKLLYMPPLLTARDIFIPGLRIKYLNFIEFKA